MKSCTKLSIKYKCIVNNIYIYIYIYIYTEKERDRDRD